jgi:mono/diheme cytochrome c family protein
MHRFIVVIVLLFTASAFADTCIDCHTSEADMKKLVVFKAAGGEEGVG